VICPNFCKFRLQKVRCRQIQHNFKCVEYLCKPRPADVQVLHFFLDEISRNFWHIMRLSITNCCKVINSQKVRFLAHRLHCYLFNYLFGGWRCGAVRLTIKRSRVRSPTRVQQRNDSGQVVHTDVPQRRHSFRSHKTLLAKYLHLYPDRGVMPPRIDFFDFGAILFACLYRIYASQLIIFSSLFPYLSPPLLIFSFENRPAPFSGRMS